LGGWSARVALNAAVLFAAALYVALAWEDR
jgi:hypothetical protein